MHLEPTAGCQISALILGGHTYPMKNYRKRSKLFVTWGLSSGKELCRPSVIVHGICIGSPSNPNIKVDI
jgi:hypothetical protein